MTLKQMRDRVARDMGLLIYDARTSPSSGVLDIDDYLNEAQRELYKMVLNQKDDYFDVYSEIPFSSFVDYEVPLPAGIFVNKVLRVTYRANNKDTELKRYKISEIEFGFKVNSADPPNPSGFTLVNKYTPGSRLGAGVLSLFPRGTYAEDIKFVRVFYKRVVSNLISDTDEPDIAESEDFLIAYAKHRVALINPSLSSVTYATDMATKLKNLLATYVDRAPVNDGGEPMEMDCDTLNNSINPVENF